jgi:hypothetical protein
VGWFGQQACWASRPDGPDWLWPIDSKTKNLNLNSKVISFWSSNQIQKFR